MVAGEYNGQPLNTGKGFIALVRSSDFLKVQDSTNAWPYLHRALVHNLSMSWGTGTSFRLTSFTLPYSSI